MQRVADSPAYERVHSEATLVGCENLNILDVESQILAVEFFNRLDDRNLEIKTGFIRARRVDHRAWFPNLQDQSLLVLANNIERIEDSDQYDRDDGKGKPAQIAHQFSPPRLAGCTRSSGR